MKQYLTSSIHNSTRQLSIPGLDYFKLVPLTQL